jgi:hypothetical protein
MSSTVSIAVSLYQGRAIRDHIEDLSLVEGRHSSWAARMAVQVQTATTAAAIFASAAVAAGRASLAGRATLIPLAVLGIESALALVGRFLKAGSQAAGLVRKLSALLPRVMAVALVVSTLALALLQPLAGIGLALHGVVALAERRQWISARAVSCLLTATTVAGLGLGIAFGSPLIKALLAVEVLAFVGRRLGAVKQALGLTPPASVEGHDPQMPRVRETLGLWADEQPIAWDEAISPLPALERQVAGVFSGLRSPTSPSLWSVSHREASGVEVRSLDKSDWIAQVERLTGRLVGWNQRLQDRSQREHCTAPLTGALRQAQSAMIGLKSCIERQRAGSGADPAQLLNRSRLQAALPQIHQQRQNMPDEVQEAVIEAFPADDQLDLHQSIERAANEGETRHLGEIEQRLVQQSQSLRNYVEGNTPDWLHQEIVAAAADLPVHPEGAVHAVLAAFERLNQQFLAGDFGPGSISSPEKAQQGWGHCLQLMREILLNEGAEVSQERQAVVLRAIAQLVAKTQDSCSGAILSAIEECFDTLRSVDRLREGFLGFLRRVGTEEASEWERNVVRWPRDLLHSLANLGLPGAQSLRALMGRPDASTAMAGAERMPWLSTSQTAALSMVRRSQVTDSEVGGLAVQVLSGWKMRSEVAARLSSVRLLVDQAAHFLMTPEGRMAWHHALATPEFREWLGNQLPGQRDQLDQLALPSAEELRQLVGGQQRFGVATGEVMPRRLWVAALLLLDHCALFKQRAER